VQPGILNTRHLGVQITKVSRALRVVGVIQPILGLRDNAIDDVRVGYGLVYYRSVTSE